MDTPRNLLMRRLVYVLIITSLAATATASVSQPNSPELQSYFDLLKEERTDLVTTGASRPMAIEKMPASVTVITAEELKLLGLRHLTDVIDYIVPGGVANIHRSVRTGLYGFRGISVDNNGKYVFMVDGHSCSELIKWGAFNERYLGLLDELDRIEITQGVGSTLYGSGAISGVIHFITKTGKSFQGTEVTAGYGSGDRVESSIKHGKKISEDSDDFYYFGFKRSNGSVPRGGSGDPSVGTTPHGKSNYADRHLGAEGRYWDHFAPSFKFHTNIERGDFSLTARYVQEKFEEPFFARPGRTGKETQYWESSDVFWFDNYFFIRPEITHKFSEISCMKANLSFGMQEMGIEKIEDWYASPAYGGGLVREEGRRVDTYGERKLSGQIYHYYDGFANHKLTSGLELFWMYAGPDFRGRDYKRAGYSGALSESINRENIYFVAGVVEDIWHLTDRDTIFAGVRVENHNLTPVSVTPRAAISHDFTEKTNLKFLYNSGYRTPSWTYYTANRAAGKDDPDPEEVQSYELHLLHKFGPKFSTSVVGYYTVYKDMINWWTGREYGNFPRVEAEGLEFVGDYRADNLKLKFSHSFSRPSSFSDAANVWTRTYLSYDLQDWAVFPTHLTKAQAIIHLIKDKCILGLTYLRPWGIKGQYYTYSKLKHPSDYLNATLTFKMNKNVELQVSGYNLTGEDNPMYGPQTYDGVSTAVNPHTEYFVRLIGRF